MNVIHSQSVSKEDNYPLEGAIPNSNKEATKIQKALRGMLARKSFLALNLYPFYSKQCSSLNESIPRASEGKTVVYLPSDLPEIVIKQTGSHQAKERFFQAEKIRSVVRREGLDRLIIPRSRVYREFLIEERFKILSDPGYNASLYLSDPSLFDEVALQMTRFFKSAYIDYLVEKNKEDDHLVRIRYDNIPLLYKEKDGRPTLCIGLIDLERSSVGEKIKSLSHRLYILSSLFPLHLDLIEAEAKKNGMVIGLEEKQKMEKAAMYGKYYLEKMSKIHLSKQAPSSVYITYPDVSGRRFGDALITYLHAKWIAFEHNLPILYRPFIYSSNLSLNEREMKYDLSDTEASKEIKYKKDTRISTPSKDAVEVYSVPYFPECKWELQCGTKHNGKPWTDYFSIDWKNPVFRKEVQSLIKPNKPFNTVVCPEDHFCIAIHYREGGGYDKDIQSLNLPLKFPPLSFYVEGIKKMALLCDKVPIYCYMFTDALDPEKHIEEIKRMLPPEFPIHFDYRREGNVHDQNVLEDFFSFFKFDALIYPQSNFSMIPALINDYVATFTVTSAAQTESGVVVEKTDFHVDDGEREKCIKRIQQKSK